MNEADILVGVQKAGSKPVLAAARGLSYFGEHALGWFGLSALGMAVDAPRRRRWAAVGVSAFLAHAASVVIKRIVRRPRPHDPRIQVGVGTPSNHSFPSSHATSTSAALVSTALLLRQPWPLLGVPIMMASRMVLGVHYPTDVTAGAVLGTTTALLVDKIEKETA